ncbi:MAG: DUF1015 domain-containing protein [Kiritimatiellia bacterium]
MRFYPFPALRPPHDLASQIASPPYDVIDSEEARRMAAGNPRTFLHINKPEIDLPEGTNLYSDAVYAKAAENFALFQQNGWLRRDERAAYYLYRQEIEGHSQTGWVGVCHTEDYEQDLIKKHERTLQKKEDDRTRHVATLKANAGPIFLMVRAPEALRTLQLKLQAGSPEVDFTSGDGVRHTVWPVTDAAEVAGLFGEIPCAYVADGHHRTASAARCSKEFAAANPSHSGRENYNWFLSVMFAADDLLVLPYNRLVKDLNGLSSPELLEKIRAAGFEVFLADEGKSASRADIRMFVDGSWYRLWKPAPADADPVSALDVSILQKDLLGPILGIEDPRTSDRISFKGGFDCELLLEKTVREKKAAVAFSLYPTSTEEVMAVADAGMIMPPKSTWFEPKLRSGLFVHTLDTDSTVSDSI